MALIGGRRYQTKKVRKNRKNRKNVKKGGNLGSIISQGALPFGLLALNNILSKKTKSRRMKKTKKLRKH